MRTRLLLALLATSCAGSEPMEKPVDDHPDMPEAHEPVVQQAENGPIGEGLLEALTDTGDLILVAAASRATVWLRLADASAPTPQIVVQAGWENGHTGPWTILEEIYAEGDQRVLAVDLETAATRLRFKSDVAVPRFRWAASVPLAPQRFGTVVDAPPPNGSIVQSRDVWMAEPARCGEADPSRTEVVLHLLPGPDAGEDDTAFLRALQAHDRDGLGWCDVRPNHLVTQSGVWMGRGARRAAPITNGEAGVAVGVLGCDDSANVRASLASLLDELTASYGLMAADRFRVEVSPMCAETAWLDDALAVWIETAPFTPIDPPITEGTVSGRVIDAMTGTPLEGVAVVCDCGENATTDAAGAYSMTLERGMYSFRFTAVDYVEATHGASVEAERRTTLDVSLAPEEVPIPGISAIDHSFLIGLWGGVDVDPLLFPETQDGFQQYLDAVGVTYFAAYEYVVPNNQAVADRCGITILLPERSWWRKGAALGLLADQLRMLVNEPVTLRNWWRPPCYNEGVGGAAGGDHPDGDALDLDFRSARSRADAQRYLCETFWLQDIVAPEDIEPGSNLNPRLNMSVGLGGVTIHLGLLSRNGRRYWKYSSYSNESSSGTCW